MASHPYVASLPSLKQVSPVAVLYQQTPPPLIDGILKPMKPGGYSDSGADIAYMLQKHGVDIITPIARPEVHNQLDWVFPDTKDGIRQAVDAGARTLWANTVLFEDHPLKAEMVRLGVSMVGQDPAIMQTIDDKWVANSLLRENGMSVARSMLVGLVDGEKDAVGLGQMTEHVLEEVGIRMPCVVKPIRGRGSQGVKKVESLNELKRVVSCFLREEYELGGVTYSKYGSRYMVEEYLCNEEITVTVMPPGMYVMGKTVVEKEGYWCLPIVERFNHENGVAPYSGVRAVVTNSKVFEASRLKEWDCRQIAKECERTASIIGAKAPIRCDCRSGRVGHGFIIFDVNMKPNMTGAGRPGRENQDSLTVMAARAIGWSYFELLANVLAQAWKPKL